MEKALEKNSPSKECCVEAIVLCSVEMVSFRAQFCARQCLLSVQMLYKNHTAVGYTCTNSSYAHIKYALLYFPIINLSVTIRQRFYVPHQSKLFYLINVVINQNLTEFLWPRLKTTQIRITSKNTIFLFQI